jgi:hypothetical protein
VALTATRSYRKRYYGKDHYRKRYYRNPSYSKGYCAILHRTPGEPALRHSFADWRLGLLVQVSPLRKEEQR